MASYRVPTILTAINLALLAWLALLAGGAALRTGTPTTLRANAIELVDDAGVVRAQWFVTPEGETLLRMRDANGQLRVKLGASQDGSGLLLSDDTAQPGLHALAERGATRLTLTGPGGQQHVIRATDP